MRDQVETIDGRVYSTDDDWQTVYVQKDTIQRRLVADTEEIALARKLAGNRATPGTRNERI